MKNKHKELLSIESNGVKDLGEGTIEFTRGLTITDDTEQRNGTRYDISTMDISEYNGMLTADHSFSVESVIGKTYDIKKGRNKITIGGIQFAVKENPLAIYVYNMMKSKFITDVSIETMGPFPDEEGIYHDAKLVGLSVVVTGNNRSARMNQIALNSIEQAKSEGLNTEEFEKQYSLDKKDDIEDNESMKYITIKNNQAFALDVAYKNAAGEDVTKTLNPNDSLDVSVDQKESVEAQIKNATAPQAEAVDVAETVKNAVAQAVAPFQTKISELETKIFDNAALEPEFKKDAAQAAATTAKTDALKNMDYRARHGLQIKHAWSMLKANDSEAGKKLNDINQIHLELLKEKGLVANSMTLGDFGNFVISPELLSDIEGHRSDFTPLLSRLNFQETMSLQMAFLKRNGDINMQEVEMCDDGADGNLKPISEYEATIETSNLHELAAVTPVCNAATRFLAADLLSDVATGYRTDYDRKRAQLFIARLQQAVNATGNSVAYSVSTTVGATALNSFINTAAEVAEEVGSGVYIFNTKTYYELVRRAMLAGINTDSGFGMFSTGAVRQIVGNDYIVVPNELMPSLNTAETKSFTVEGTSVTINKAVFYVDLSTFSGRTSGGLQYDLSTDAAYEVGSDVRSAFQRNEIVLRGSFFRGGVIRDEDKVAAMSAAGIS